MNTNRDASAHTRRLAARTITMDHLINLVRRGLNTDMAASYMTKIQLGPADNFLKPISFRAQKKTLSEYNYKRSALILLNKIRNR